MAESEQHDYSQLLADYRLALRRASDFGNRDEAAMHAQNAADKALRSLGEAPKDVDQARIYWARVAELAAEFAPYSSFRRGGDALPDASELEAAIARGVEILASGVPEGYLVARIRPCVSSKGFGVQLSFGREDLEQPGTIRPHAVRSVLLEEVAESAVVIKGSGNMGGVAVNSTLPAIVDAAS